MPSFADYIRFAPAARLASRIRRQFNGGLSVWLLKAAVRQMSRRKLRGRNRHDPSAWRAMWQTVEAPGWPRSPVTGIVEISGIRLVIDRGEITPDGHLWVDGWVVGPDPGSVKLAAIGCTIEWQATFRTSRPDVVRALTLSRTGPDGQVGFQILAAIAGHVSGRSRLALVAPVDGDDAGIVVPVVPEVERSGDLWQSVYDAMRFRGPRDAAYLKTSVGLLAGLRKSDWRERTQSLSRAIDAALAPNTGLKVLLLSRFHPNAAYLNMNVLAAALGAPAQFVICSMGQKAIRRANEYREHFATIGDHKVTFVNGEVTTPSSEVIEQFAVMCKARGCPALIIYDDVAAVSAMASLTAALHRGAACYGVATAWPRRLASGGPETLAFVQPLDHHDGLGPYWLQATRMNHEALGAVLFDAGAIDVPTIPAFEGRGWGLEYLVDKALPAASTAQEPLLDLVDPAGQREVEALDMLMLLASREGPAR